MSRISSFGSYRAGAMLASERGVSMERSLCRNNTVFDEEVEWKRHFNEHVLKSRKSLPRPLMYRAEPCWAGDLKPEGSKELEEGYVWVSAMSCKHVIVGEEMLREPSNKEYEAYFKSHIKGGVYYIKESKKKKMKIRIIFKRKTDDS